MTGSADDERRRAGRPWAEVRGASQEINNLALLLRKWIDKAELAVVDLIAKLTPDHFSSGKIPGRAKVYALLKGIDLETELGLEFAEAVVDLCEAPSDQRAERLIEARDHWNIAQHPGPAGTESGLRELVVTQRKLIEKQEQLDRLRQAFHDSQNVRRQAQAVIMLLMVMVDRSQQAVDAWQRECDQLGNLLTSGTAEQLRAAQSRLVAAKRHESQAQTLLPRAQQDSRIARQVADRALRLIRQMSDTINELQQPAPDPSESGTTQEAVLSTALAVSGPTAGPGGFMVDADATLRSMRNLLDRGEAVLEEAAEQVARAAFHGDVKTASDLSRTIENNRRHLLAWLSAFLHREGTGTGLVSEFVLLSGITPEAHRERLLATTAAGDTSPALQFARLLEADGHQGEAEELYRHLRSVGDTQASLHLAHLLQDTDRSEEVEPLHREALDDGHVEAALDLAHLAAQEGRFDEVESLARRACFDDAPDIATAIGVLLEEASRMTGAEAIYRGAYHLGSVRAGRQLAQLLMKTGRPHEAWLLPGETRGQSDADDIDGSLTEIRDLVTSLMADEDHASGCLAAFERHAGISHQTHTSILLTTLAQGSTTPALQLARLLEADARLDEAERLYRLLWKAGDLQARMFLSHALLDSGRHAEAMALHRDALKDGDSTAALHLALITEDYEGHEDYEETE